EGAVIMLAGEVAGMLGSELPVPTLSAEPDWLYRARVRRTISPPAPWWMQPSTPSREHEVERARRIAGEDDVKARDAAFAICRERWPSIFAVAERLLAEGRLEGVEVARIAAAAGSPPPAASVPRREPVTPRPSSPGSLELSEVR